MSRAPVTAFPSPPDISPEAVAAGSITFAQLGLPEPVLRAVSKAGYATPTPIQVQTIPVLLAGGDVLGQAQTGTGKTAAFTLPLLARLPDKRGEGPSILVLAPTRELALQVAGAMKLYGQFKAGLRVLPVYGGASFVPQLRGLREGADVIVGTPGRVMDHLRRGTLDLGALQALVLDEADEMLRMGFIDDVKWILEQTPEDRQIALFSATMPPEIRRIADRALKNPTHVIIGGGASAADTVRQRYLPCRHHDKAQALAHLLAVEDTEGVLVFVRTRRATEELVAALQRYGVRGTALSGDVAQRQREHIVEQLRRGDLKLIVATDVAARGLDVRAISHVINFDFPEGPETYVHRIGRTGRAGRSGEAILLVTPGEMRRLSMLERATKRPLEPFAFPTKSELKARRLEAIRGDLTRLLDAPGIDDLEAVVAAYATEHNVSPSRLAGALLRELRGSEPVVPVYTPPPLVAGRREAEGQGPRPNRRGPARPSHRPWERSKKRSPPRPKKPGEKPIEGRRGAA